jgi:hypothetical protein
MSAPDRDLEAQAPQANTVTSEQTDEFQQLQEQLRATQQQLQEAKGCTKRPGERFREDQLGKCGTIEAIEDKRGGK